MLAPACARENTAKTTVPLAGASEICELRPNHFGLRYLAERLRSAARDLTRTTPLDSIASPLDRVVPGGDSSGVGGPYIPDPFLQGETDCPQSRIARRFAARPEKTSTASIHSRCTNHAARFRRLDVATDFLSRASVRQRLSFSPTAATAAAFPLFLYLFMPPELGRPERTSMRPASSSLASRIARNGPDQWLATERLSTPPGFIASPLHRLVRHRAKRSRGALESTRSLRHHRTPRL